MMPWTHCRLVDTEYCCASWFPQDVVSLEVAELGTAIGTMNVIDESQCTTCSMTFPCSKTDASRKTVLVVCSFLPRHMCSCISILGLLAILLAIHRDEQFQGDGFLMSYPLLNDPRKLVIITIFSGIVYMLVFMDKPLQIVGLSMRTTWR